jgi:hypothetical protein
MANYNRAWLRRNQAGADLAPSMPQTTAPVGDGPIKFAIAINPGLSYRGHARGTSLPNLSRRGGKDWELTI